MVRRRGRKKAGLGVQGVGFDSLVFVLVQNDKKGYVRVSAKASGSKSPTSVNPIQIQPISPLPHLPSRHFLSLLHMRRPPIQLHRLLHSPLPLHIPPPIIYQHRPKLILHMLPRPHVEDIIQLLEAHGRHAREVVGRVVGDGRARRFGHEEEDEDEGEGVEAREEEEEAEMPDFRYG